MTEGRNRGWSPLAWLGVGLIAAVGLMAVFGTLVSVYGWGGPGYGMMGGGNWWAWAALMMGIPTVILLVVLVVALTGLSEGDQRRETASSRTSPIGMLEERYARGEVGREEYLLARADLARPSEPA